MAVLASGTGTILAALLSAGVPVAVVLVDRRCPAEEVAARAGVEVAVVERREFGPRFDRQGYTDEVVRALEPFEPALVAMAGFGTVLAPSFFSAFPDRVLNTHPSLLPAFTGWHAVQAALDAGVEVTGCTVHLATAEVDEGPILAQEEVAVRPGDSVESLHERIKSVERRIYPETVLGVLAEATAVGAATGRRERG